MSDTEYIKLKVGENLIHSLVSNFALVQVVGQDYKEIHFRVKQTTQMGTLKKSYSERVGVPVTSLRYQTSPDLSSLISESLLFSNFCFPQVFV